MISKTSEWKRYFFGTKTLPHLKWLESGAEGAGRIDLEEKNLTRAILRGETFTKARFVRCDWSNSNISGDFTEAEITECIWNNSLLYSIRFNRASIENCNFVDAYLGLCDFIEAKIQGGDWTRSDLDKSTWTSAVVENACFQKVNFSEARFHGSRFVDCDLRQADLESATLRDAVFEHCDFRGAYLDDFVFEKVTFIKCGFYGCVGVPAFEGEYTLIESDLSEGFDGTGIVESEQLLEQWQSHGDQSQSKIVISLADSPQWLDYLSRDNRGTQVKWVSAGQKGSRPMDLAEKDLSRAFAYQAYLRAARFTNCDFTASDLRRSKVQQAEFIGCTFNNALLMYLESRQELYLDVETTKVIFQNCIAHGAYFNRSELWQPEFIGGNWDGSFFNNCIWTCAEIRDVSLENTDWRGAKLDTVKFINCSFTNAKFHEAELRAIQFINCNFQDTDFGHVKGSIVKMKECRFSGTKGMLFDIEPLKDGEIRVINADLSVNFDGSLVLESLKTTQDLFDRIRDIPSDKDNLTEESIELTTETERQDKKESMKEKPKATESKEPLKPQPELQSEQKQLTNVESQLNKDEPESEQFTETERQNEHEPESGAEKPELTETRELSQIQQELQSEQERLTNLESQLRKVEQQIENARRTNIFGRPQSGDNERERDSLVAEIAEIKHRIAQNESLLRSEEEQ